MLSFVSVPVLSIQSTSILPKPCMALISLMMVCLRLMLRLPLARQAVITIGSISGISPTATESANAKDSNHFPPVSLNSANTMGISTTIKRSITHAIELAPFWNDCFSSASDFSKLPYNVSFPTASTIPSPLPPITVVAIKARFSSCVSVSVLP